MDDENDALWRRATEGVRPLKKRTVVASPPPSARPRLRQSQDAPVPLAPVSAGRTAMSNGLDRRTAERLQNGQMPVEARLDLHGLRQDAAREALRLFIARSHARGLRCVLIITGKGAPPGEQQPWYEEPPSGILRARVPQWLSDASLAPVILRVTPAQPRHGGDGALYVLLRRKRD